MTDLEAAVLDILRKARPGALTLTDLHAKLVERKWDVRSIIPRHITDACIALDEAGHVRNELAWHALADAPESKS